MNSKYLCFICFYIQNITIASQDDDIPKKFNFIIFDLKMVDFATTLIISTRDCAGCESVRRNLTTQPPQFAHCGSNHVIFIPCTRNITLAFRTRASAQDTGLQLLAVTIGLISGSVPDFQERRVLHCTRVRNKNLR